ncbi:hypothetical protein [Cellulophaga lytica]|uniref:hypothetical protein n=1 Tax=Cellulophaga lytica TaxID=979 RepID=UPI000B5CE556|nr:hypothetical protein [Cellulophaga lytica]SNQ45035.1 hypothetical protein CL8139_770001 [Cellulophaga lytica]
MKNGFEFIENRPLGEIIDFKKWEDKYQLVLPPIFKTFIENFKIESELKNIKFLDSDEDESQLGTIRFNNGNISILISNFMSIKDIYTDWKGGGEFEEWEKYGIIRIGHLGESGGGGICIGNTDRNKDEIWQLNWDTPEYNRKIANNIFEFVRGLSFTTEFSNLDRIDYPKLYKKWGDSHWKLNH